MKKHMSVLLVSAVRSFLSESAQQLIEEKEKSKSWARFCSNENMFLGRQGPSAECLYPDVTGVTTGRSRLGMLHRRLNVLDTSTSPAAGRQRTAWFNH